MQDRIAHTAAGGRTDPPAPARARRRRSARGRWRAYAAAIVLTPGLLWICAVKLPALVAEHALPVFFLPIVVSAALGGIGAGLFATAIAGFGTNYFLLEPQGSFSIASGWQSVEWLLLVLAGIFSSVVAELRLVARRRAAPVPHGGFSDRGRIYAGFVLVAFIVLGIGLLTYRSIQSLREHDRAVRQSEVLISKVHLTLATITDVETAQRGYTITGQDAYLGPYLDAIAYIDGLLHELDAAAAGHSDQQARIEMLMPLVKQRLDIAKAIIEARRLRGFEAAQALTLAGTGKRIHDEIRAIADQVEQAEAARLAQQERHVTRDMRLVYMMLIAAGAVAFAILLVAIVWIERDFDVSQRLLEGLRKARGRLERRVERRTADRDAAYSALRANEERLQLVLDGAGEAFWDWNLVTNEVFFSPRWQSLRGLEDVATTGDATRWSAGIYPDDLPRVMQAVEAHLAQHTPYSCEYRIRHRDGHYLWILDRGAARWGADGRPIRMTGTEKDITERKAAEASLRDKEAFSRQIVESASTGLVVLDHELRYVRWNRGMEEMSGVAETQLLGKPYDDPRTCMEQPEIHEICTGALSGAPSAPREIHVVGQHGELWAIASGGPWRADDGRIVGVIISILDNTVRRKKELQVRQLIEVLRRMHRRLTEDIDEERRRIAHALHDQMGQDFAALRLNIDRLLLRVQHDAWCVSTGENIRRTLDSMGVAIRRILADLRPLLLDGAGLLQAFKDHIRGFETTHGIAVDLNSRGDAARLPARTSVALFRCLQESLTNVVKHARATEVWVVLDISAHDVTLSVRDNGGGIASDSPSYGLVGMREQAALLDGTLTLTNAPGGGAQLRVTLPLPPSHPARSSP